MSKWLWFVFSFAISSKAFCFTPIYSVHDNTRKIDEEFSNVEQDLQSQQFTTFTSTPNLNDLKDGQIVIVSSGSYNKLMYRTGLDIYAISVSCATIRR